MPGKKRIILNLLIFIHLNVLGQLIDPFSVDDPFKKHETLTQELVSLTQKIKQNPNDPQRYLERAKTNANIENIEWWIYESFKGKDNYWDEEQILKDLNKAIFLGLETAEIYRMRGRYYSDTKNFAAALQDFGKAYEFDPDQDAEYYYHRGKSFQGLEKRKEALSDFNKAIEMSPAEGKYLLRRGVLKIALGNLDGAIEDLERSAQINPFLANEAIFYIVEVRKGTGNFEGVQSFIDLTEKKSTFGPVRLGLRAELKQGVKDFEGALSDLNVALTLCHKEYSCDSDWLRQLYALRADTKFSLSDLSGALSDQDEVIKLGRHGDTYQDMTGIVHTFDNSYPYFKKAYYKASGNDLAGALKEINKTIKFYKDVYGDTAQIDQSQATYRQLRAQIKFSMGDLPGSYEDYREAWMFDSHEPSRWTSVAGTLVRLNDIPGAIEFLEQAENWGIDQDIHILNALGNYLNEVNRYEKARDCLKKCVSIEPEYLDAYLGLATTAFYMQDKALADSHLSRARTLAKKDGYDHLSIEMLKKTGRWEVFLPKKRKALTALL